MSGIVYEAGRIWDDLTTGRCWKSFQEMETGDKVKTVLKVVGIALLAGIIAGVIGGLGGPLLGALLGVTVAAVVATTAFSCYTADHCLGEKLGALAKTLATDVKKAL